MIRCKAYKFLKTYVLIAHMFFFMTNYCISQNNNLVFNPSLEDTLRIQPLPSKYDVLGDKFKNCKNWFATDGVVYRNYGKHNYTKNIQTGTETFDKSCHAIIYTKYYGEISYLNGFLIASLKKPLIKDSIYRFSYLIKPFTDNIAYVNKDLQSVFLDVPKINPTKFPYNINATKIRDTINDWKIVYGTYKAKGNERFFGIGQFNIERKDFIKTKKHRKKSKIAVMLFDLLNIEPAYKTFETNKVISKKEDELSSILKKEPDIKLFFKNDSYTITKTEKKKLIDFLKRIKKQDIIEIYGYTNSKGSDKYNLILSKKRAESVKNYLVKIGVNNKIRTIAKGIVFSDSISPDLLRFTHIILKKP